MQKASLSQKFTKAAKGEQSEASSLKHIGDVALGVAVHLGEAEITIRELLSLKAGSVLELKKRSDEPFDFRVNGKLTAHGDIVVVNDRYAIRLSSIVSPDDEID